MVLKTTRTLCAAVIGAALGLTLILAGCTSPFNAPESFREAPPAGTGKGLVQLSVQTGSAAARTIAPAVTVTSMVATFTPSTEGAEPVADRILSGDPSQDTVSLSGGSWTIKVTVHTDSGPYMYGEQQVNVNAGSSTGVTITVDSLERGSGIFTYEIIAPAGSTVEGTLTLAKDTNQSYTFEDLAGYLTPPSGIYILKLTINSGAQKTYRTEAVYIAAGLTTSARYTFEMVTSITLSKTALKIGVGDTAVLTAVISPVDAANKNVSWSSSDTSIATVDSTGKVTGIATGETNITGTTEDGSFTGTCAVTVAPSVILEAGNKDALSTALATIKDEKSKKYFTILITADFSADPINLNETDYNDKTISIRSKDSTIREIRLNSEGPGSLFTIDSSSLTLVLQDINLTGKSDNNDPLVKVQNGALVLMARGKISGNTASYGGGVYVGDTGTFTMESGEISGNTASNGGGGVYVSAGTFTMEGGKISRNKALSVGETGSEAGNLDGGGIYVGGSGMFTMKSGEISDNTASNEGGGVYVSDGTFTIEGGKINRNKASSSSGGGIFVGGSDGKFTMKGGEISGNEASSGGGIYVGGSGTFTIKSGEISGNTASSGGGGVYVSDGTFTMKDGKISGNKASSGGGVLVSGSDGEFTGTFTMKGGEISDNKTSYYGGGVYVGGNGTFTMKSGKISGNEASCGGGVYVSDGTFTMEDGEINGNKTSNYYGGGGVYVGGTGTFTMEGGKVSGNSAPYSGSSCSGGGIFVYSGTFTMKDGEISGNTSSYSGGGVFVNSGTFTMEGGKISGNTSSYSGGGVFVNGGTFTKSGGVITGYEGDTATGNKVAGSDGQLISGQGHAVYTASGKCRETTVSAEQTLDSSKDGNDGGWAENK